MLVGAPICLEQFRIEHVFYREFAAREKSLFIHWNHRVPPCQGEESESIVPRRTSSSTCTVFFEKESAKTKNKAPPRLTHKTAEATGYIERTVRRIVSEKSAQSGAAFCSPAKRYKLDRKKIVLDDFDTEALRRAIHEFYSEKKYPTMDSLLSAVKKRKVFSVENAQRCGELYVRWVLSTKR